VDSSKDAIDMCDQNVAANFNNAPHASYVQDVFDFMKQNKEDYDIMVLDPPAFAKNAKAVPNASRGYKNLNLIAFKTIKPGGLVFTFSCSQHIDRDLFRKIVFGAAADAGRNVRILKQLTQPEDHPINIFHPEGEYLKGLLLHVE
jgi:23S rRNA (cytosine1962-C5)-methyltransferase